MTKFDPTDLAGSRLPIVFSFLALCVLGAVQLYLGSSLPVVALAVLGATISFIPLHLYGCESYSLFSIVFGLRFILAGVILKTLYGQSLDSHLFNPVAAYSMALLVVSLTTTVLMIARRFDPRRDFFSVPLDPASLRKLALASFALGLVCMGFVSLADKNSTSGNAGPIMVAAHMLGSIASLGFVAEAMRTVRVSGGRQLISPMLVAMFGFVFLAVLALNMRGFLLDCAISVALVGIVYRAISLKLVLAGGVFALFFVNFMTPLTLYLRANKELPPAVFTELAVNTAGRMIVDPDFRKVIITTTSLAKTQGDVDDVDYDYFGNRANVENRLAGVGLIDAVINGMKGHALVGYPAVEQSLAAVMPGFLGFVKEAVGMGDWLGWRVGLIEYPNRSYIVFGLFNEAYATWGLVGVFIYPFLFMLPVFLLLARFSSLRSATPVSIFLVSTMQAELVEATSNGLLNIIMRGAPVLFVALLGLRYALFTRPKRFSALDRARRRAEISSVEI